MKKPVMLIAGMTFLLSILGKSWKWAENMIYMVYMSAPPEKVCHLYWRLDLIVMFINGMTPLLYIMLIEGMMPLLFVMFIEGMTSSLSN